MQRLIDCCPVRELIPPMAKGMISRFNPSITKLGDEFIITVREATYSYDTIDNKAKTRFATTYTRWFTENYIAKTKDPFEDTLHWNRLKWIERNRSQYSIYQGIEDVRLNIIDNMLFYSATRRDIDGDKGFIVQGKIDTRDWRCFEEKILPAKTLLEKNYMPFEGKRLFLYSVNPFILLEDSFSEIKQEYRIPENLRGSSQFIEYKDGWAGIVHSVCKETGYCHNFIFLDKEYKIQKISFPFKFDNEFIEFCCGMTIHENQFYITYGTMDRRAFLVKINEEFVNFLK